MEAGFHGNKRLLQQSGEERGKLAASERALQKQLQQALADAQQAQRECARHAADAAVARAELQQSTAVRPLTNHGSLTELGACLRPHADNMRMRTCNRRRPDASQPAHQCPQLSSL